MIENTRERIWIGTSNIVLPGNKSTFPGEFQSRSRLNYYSSLFNSVELNSTFYKVPMAATFKKWADDAGPAFRFSVKLWQGITHAKDCKFSEEDIERFVKNASMLQENKGCLLLQFPGKITLDYFNQVEHMLRMLTHAQNVNTWNMAVEFRNASWYTGETMELLDGYNASLVLHDYPKGKNNELNKKAPVAYIRFHGPTGDYRGSYSHESLLQKTAEIQQWLKSGKEVYTYFNNTIGDAYQNAHTLKKLLREPGA